MKEEGEGEGERRSDVNCIAIAIMKINKIVTPPLSLSLLLHLP
jgi:hypothetical protein